MNRLNERCPRCAPEYQGLHTYKPDPACVVCKGAGVPPWRTWINVGADLHWYLPGCAVVLAPCEGGALVMIKLAGQLVHAQEVGGGVEAAKEAAKVVVMNYGATLAVVGNSPRQPAHKPDLAPRRDGAGFIVTSRFVRGLEVVRVEHPESNRWIEYNPGFARLAQRADMEENARRTLLDEWRANGGAK